MKQSGSTYQQLPFNTPIEIPERLLPIMMRVFAGMITGKKIRPDDGHELGGVYLHPGKCYIMVWMGGGRDVIARYLANNA